MLQGRGGGGQDKSRINEGNDINEGGNHGQIETGTDEEEEEGELMSSLLLSKPEQEFVTFKEPRNRFRQPGGPVSIDLL